MRMRQLGIALLIALIAGTAGWVALGRPRPHLPAVNAPPIVAVSAPSALTYAEVARAHEHNGQFPSAITISGYRVAVTTLSHASARLCVNKVCELISGQTITTEVDHE